MTKTLIETISPLLNKVFLKTVEETLSVKKTELLSKATSEIMQIFARASGNFIIEVSLAFLKIILESKDSMRVIEREVKKLVSEPLRTGIEQLKIAGVLNSKTKAQNQHKISRYRQALDNFDSALSLAEENEKPFINLLRGLVSVNIPGAEEEAVIHLRNFQVACQKIAEHVSSVASLEEKNALEEERDAEAIKVQISPGVGGGLIGMARAEPLIQKAHLLHEADKRRKKVESLKFTRDQILNSILAIEILISLVQERSVS
jgi:hypothetical protein